MRLFSRPAASARCIVPRHPILRAAGLLALGTLILSAGHAQVRPDFTLIVLPDTQFYSATMHGGSPDLFEAQTRWIVASRDTLRTAFVTHLGDIVQDGDEALLEWDAADAAMSILEDPETTGLPDGIPYGMAIGNHDQSPQGDADGATNSFNRLFGAERFAGRSYHGGHFGDSFDNHYELFSASGLDFIVLHFEYDNSPDSLVLDWAESVLDQHATRRAIVVTHNLMGPGNPGGFSGHGAILYERLSAHPNLFLMLGGHVLGEGRRTDVRDGRTVHSLLADYQGREKGGNGWLRILRFFPDRDEIHVRTFNPVLNDGRGAFEVDEDSDFVLPYEM